MAAKLRWVPSAPGDPRARKLQCCRCDGETFTLVHTRMGSHKRVQKAHDMRLVATCAKCKPDQKQRVGYRG
jgi:hypothetical protein